MKAALLAASLALLTCASASHSREMVGAGFVDNRMVQLFSDGTWEFLPVPLAEGCDLIDETVRVCDQDRVWRRSSGPDFDYDAIFTNTLSDRVFAAVASQSYGRNEGQNFDTMIAQTIETTAAAEGISVDAVPVHEVEDSSMSGYAAKRLVVGFRQDGLRQINAFTFVVEDSFSVLALTWAIGDAFSDEMRSAHDDFVGKLLILNADEVDQ